MSLQLDQELINALETASKAISANEQFPVIGLAVRAEKAAQGNPHDTMLATGAKILSKMAKDNRFTISRAELNKLHDEIYSPNSKFAEVFEKELDRSALPGPQTFKRDEFENSPITLDYERVGADSILTNALTSAFEGKYAPYSDRAGNQAKTMCLAELRSMDLEPKKLEIFAGNSDAIICQASYETPKGYSYALIPVELKNDQPLFPNMFLSRAGFMDLQKEGLTQHLKVTAGQSFRVDGEQLLNLISQAKNGVKTGVSEVELAVSHLKAKKETPAIYDNNGILLGSIGYEAIDREKTAVELPEVPKDPEVESFARKLSSKAGEAGQIFGTGVVERGREMLSRKLRGFGYNPQISVADYDEKTIHYAVSLDRRAGIKVPVRISGGLVHPPSIVVASGKIGKFSSDGIKELTKGELDVRAMAVASPLYDLKPSELLGQLRDALSEENLVRAEDAIMALADKDEGAHKFATQLLINHLNGAGLEKVASDEVERDKKFDDIPGGFITNSIHLDY